MPISGYVAGGASEALEEVLDRRLKEQIRQQQEKQHADQVAIQRQQIDLQQKRDAAMDLERSEDRKWRQGERDIATAQRAEADTDPGAISPEIAAVLSKDPAIAGRISQRKVIDASPIAAQSVLPGTVTPQGAGDVSGPTMQTGDRPMPRMISNLTPRAAAPTAMGGAVTAGVDASGPQQYPVLGATPKQAQAAKLKSDTDTFYEELARTSGEDAKRDLAARARRVGVQLDPSLIAPSEAEKRQTATQAQLEAERRADDRWYQHEGWSLRNQKEHPAVWVTKNGQDQFVTPSQAAALAHDGWKHSQTGAGASEDEMKTAGFYKQMTQAIRVLDEVEGDLSQKDLYQIQSLSQEDLIGLMNRGKMSEPAKRYLRAFEQFTEARLRPVSGAAISDTEFARDRRTYAKQYGETPQLNADRREARASALDSLRVRSGRALARTAPTEGGGTGDGIPKVVKNPKTGKWEVEK